MSSHRPAAAKQWRKTAFQGLYNKPTWHDHLVAALAPVAILPGATLATHYLAIVSRAEWLAGQGLVALGAAETVLVPVAVLMVQLLRGGETKRGTG